MRVVHVTMTPDTAYLVDDEEYADLERQGLLISGRGDVPPLGATGLSEAPSPFTLPRTDETPKEEDGGTAEEEPEADRGEDPQPAA